jgi:hypothetical protein
VTTDRTALLEAVAEAARRVSAEYEEDVPMRSMPPLRKALVALDAIPATDIPDPAAVERAEIVAWLRKEEDNFCPVYCQAGNDVAEAIERGEHKAGPVGGAVACRYVADLLERGK